MKHSARRQSAVEPADIRARCPWCGDWARFEPTVVSDLYLESSDARFGVRFCPNPECPPVFVARMADGQALTLPKAKPSLLVESNDLPVGIRRSFREACDCHEADAYRAAVMMVRRTLEEASDNQGAEGKDLWARIENLKPRLLLSESLYDAMHELRLLGSDAAHVESRHYADVTGIEAEIALQFAAEILRSLYSHPALLDKLRAQRRDAE